MSLNLSRRQILAAALAVPAVGAATALPPPTPAAAPWRLSPERLDQALQRMVAEGRAAGVSALVWQAGAERYFRAVGQADREAGRPMARDTLARIWSMTKPVASVALMRLWEQGRFRLDDPLGRYLPEFKAMRVHADDGRGERPAERPILVRDILRHTSGLTYGMEDGPADRAFRTADPMAKARSLAELSRLVAALPLRHEPGTAWQYGTSTDIVARLVEVLADAPFDAQVRRHVLLPLGMQETDWTVPDARRGRLATTYQVASAGQPLQREPDPAPTFATGGFGLIGPIDDYMRFARMLLGEGTLDGTRLLRPNTVQLMLTDQLDPAIQPRHFMNRPAVGFGLAGAVRTANAAAGETPGMAGEFSWSGMASTLFWVDPANALAVVFFTQKLPFDVALHMEMKRAVYGT